MTLALPVMNPRLPGHELLKTGYELSPSILEKLEDMSIRMLWVDYPSLSYLNKFIDPVAVQNQTHVIGQIKHTFEALQDESAPKLDYDTYTHSIAALVESVVTHPDAAIFLGDLCHQDDRQGMMRHSAAVTYLSLLIGLKLEDYVTKQRRHITGDRAKEVTNLGLGAMLHDIGVTLLPREVVARHEATGDPTDPAWREHTALGYQTVRGKVDPTAAIVLLHHHQRYDGSGYTGQGFQTQTGDSIHIFPRIVAVADVFTRLRRPAGKPEMPAVAALAAMLAPEMRKGFDPRVLCGLIEVAPPYPPGAHVRLSSGEHAVVIDYNVADPCRPVVKMLVGDVFPPEGEKLGPTVDLSQQPEDLQVVACDDVPTGDYNFQPEEIPGYQEAIRGWV